MIIFTLIVLSYSAPILPTTSPTHGALFSWQGHCRDGDTCIVLLNLGLGVWRETPIRLCDVDTPEKRSIDENERARAEEARILTQATLSHATKIRIHVAYNSRGNPVYSFDRLLAWVQADGKDIGTILLNNNLARLIDKRCPRYDN